LGVGDVLKDFALEELGEKQEKATMNSNRHSAQTTRAKPDSNRPQSMNEKTAESQ
jgi:hypothetical protein